MAATQALRTIEPLTNSDFEPPGGQPGPGARLYGPTQAFNDKSFKLPDFERLV